MLQNLTSSDQIHPEEESWQVSYTGIDKCLWGLLWKKNVPEFLSGIWKMRVSEVPGFPVWGVGCGMAA